MEFFDTFKEKWQKNLPSAVKCLESSLDACLTFFICPEEEWISLRTTNIIERLNKEFKRRTKPMEIVAGENACYMLLTFISLKMELHWIANPIGKVGRNLPFFQRLALQNFTKKSWQCRPFWVDFSRCTSWLEVTGWMVILGQRFGRK